ncbi:hypothetical protein BU17DRAFT_97352 [Hysterangium stoloniferum]|nr:hypothetical protein BU17DRAFT_97352 [Hysterangium stoloniferum]
MKTIGLSAYPPRLTTLPFDVLQHIAISTLPNIPIPDDLQTIFSLLLTCRSLNAPLSADHNYELYGNIFRLMFDIRAVTERLGPQAIRSSTLTSALRSRCILLKRIKSKFQAAKFDEADSESLFTDLTRLFLIMTEDDGKNRYQLLNLAIPRHTQGSAARRALNQKLHHSKTPMFAYFVAIALMNESEEDVRAENHDVRERILDLLEPFTSFDNTSTEIYQTELTHAISWHGVSCLYTPPTLTYLARLSTVTRYNVIKWTRDANVEYAQRSTPQLQTYWKHHIRVSPPVGGAAVTVPLVSSGSLQGSWVGCFIILANMDPPPKIFICTQPMQITIREFVSVVKEEALPSFDLGGTSRTREAFPHLWFPQDVTFKETPAALNIRLPNGRSLEYQSVSNVDLNGNMTVFDTILIGETEPSHGSRYGHYTFKGRVNHREGTVTIVRTPRDTAMSALGTWVFCGQMQDEGSLMGDWWAPCSPSQVPAARGWFHLSKMREVCA